MRAVNLTLEEMYEQRGASEIDFGMRAPLSEFTKFFDLLLGVVSVFAQS